MMRYNERLAKHSTIGIGGTVTAWHAPSSVDQLRRTIVSLADAGARVITLGAGSNTLMPDGHLEAAVISLSKKAFTYINFNGEFVTAGAGAKLSTLVSESCSRGLGGLEGLAGIPGTVGGALATNAGYVGTISDCLAEVTVIDGDGDIRKIEKKDLEFGYRKSPFGNGRIIIDATFRLKKAPENDLKNMLNKYFSERTRSQPMDQKTLGCIFKNPESGPKAAELIERAGLKGMRRGMAVVSEEHANFIVNSGGATSRDVCALVEEIQNRVREKFAVNLEPEIEILE